MELNRIKGDAKTNKIPQKKAETPAMPKTQLQNEPEHELIESTGRIKESGRGHQEPNKKQQSEVKIIEQEDQESAGAVQNQSNKQQE